MRGFTVLTGFVALVSANLRFKPAARGEHELLEGRQANLAYPANTIDMPVNSLRSCVLVYSNIFHQIDHFPHSDKYKPHVNGTFKQRYFFDSSYYKPGGPVYLYVSGETSGPNRFSNLQTGSK
jgi:hypothetical protein